MVTLRQISACAVALTVLALAEAAGNAGPARGHLSLACSNGRTYALSPRAVAVDGDLVTGYLHLSPRNAVHVRLIPMGDGYRYAGRGIWLDGIRGDATLHFGKHRTVGCSVLPV